MPTSWPPTPFDRAQSRMAECDAWYVGDTERLAGVYQHTARTRPSQYRGGLVGSVARFFWGRQLRAVVREEMAKVVRVDVNVEALGQEAPGV